MEASDYLSTEEAASILGYTPQHVGRLIRCGALEGKKLGRDWLVLRESVHRRLETRANYNLPFRGVRQRAANKERRGTDGAPGGLSFEDILSGGEPSLEQKRLAKRLAWSNGAAPKETVHRVYLGDARQMEQIGDEPVHLVVTSPPYFNLVEYEGATAEQGQLGSFSDYERFLDELDAVWRRCFDLLVPGGRMCIVVGDVCISRRRAGRHHVLPLHADIATRCRRLGFDYLTPILWSKIANMATEVDGPGGFLGKPYEPNAIIKNDVEYILLLRKPGQYRKPSAAQRALSLLEPEEHARWFRSIWTDIRGESRRAGHPAPFPVELAYRLIKMFSFVGDTVLDPFWGTGSTTVAAIDAVRSSIGFEIEPRYLQIGRERLAQVSAAQVPPRIEFHGALGTG
ncbi:MAG TPA: DNA methyltransferase [Longimicrobiales bacterium]